MILQDIENLSLSKHLSIYGALHPDPNELGRNVRTLILLGPKEPGFWGHFTASPEYLDTRPDPLDRWSERVIGKLAKDLNAKAYFPFGGPPYQPFISWAKASGRAYVSPVGLLVHDVAGLMVSYRGALALDERLDLPETKPSPCLQCEKQSCRDACPVDAMTLDNYDVTACKADLESPNNDCMSMGCAVRRACPLSQSYGRVEAQSAFHMEAFK